MSAKNKQVGENPTKEQKRSRPNTRSFVADKDVQTMLTRATSRGVALTWLCNTGLRKLLTEQGYARKKEASI